MLAQMLWFNPSLNGRYVFFNITFTVCRFSMYLDQLLTLLKVFCCHLNQIVSYRHHKSPSFNPIPASVGFR
jgi:hypothetical protein